MHADSVTLTRNENQLKVVHTYVRAVASTKNAHQNLRFGRGLPSTLKHEASIGAKYANRASHPSDQMFGFKLRTLHA